MATGDVSDTTRGTLHAAARLAFLAFCMVQIDIYTGKTQLLDSNIKIVDAQDTAGIASGTRLLIQF